MRRVCIPAGIVREAVFSVAPPAFIKPTKSTGARRTGEVYESKAQEYIVRQVDPDARATDWPIEIIRSPWIEFASEGDKSGTVRYCQPDCLLVDREACKVTAIEIKLQHCYEAYVQLRKLYEPVLRFMFPQYAFAAVELVQWHDAHVVFPEKYYYEEKLANAEKGRLALHIWNPRYDPLSRLMSKSKVR